MGTNLIREVYISESHLSLFLMAKLWSGSQSGSSLLHKNHQLCKIPCASRLRSCIRIATAISTIIRTMPVSKATVCEGSRCTCDLLCQQRGSGGSRFYLLTGTQASKSILGNAADWHLSSEHMYAKLPSALNLRMPLQHSFVFALMILYRSNEIQHLRELIVTS